jgi:hypothetical protein
MSTLTPARRPTGFAARVQAPSARRIGRRNGDRVRAGQRIEGEREIERPVHVEKDPAHLAAQRQAQCSQMLFATRMGNQIVTEMLAQPAQCMAHRRLAQPHPPPRLGQGRCVKNGVKGIEHIEVKPMNRRLCDARANLVPVTHRLLHSHHNGFSHIFFR